MPGTGSKSPWNSAAALFCPSPTRCANENRQRLRGIRRLFRPRHHVVDGGPDLGVAQRGVPAFGRHRSRAPLYPIEGAGVESAEALDDVLGPLALVTQLRRAGDASIVARDAGGLVDLLPVAAGWRRGRRAFYRLPLRFRRCDVDLGDGSDPLGHADRKSTRLNSSHSQISYAVFCLKKKNYIYRYNLFLLSSTSYDC